jgi:hypothetical protein
MSHFAVIVDVMFGVYLVNFISGWVAEFFAARPKARMWAEIGIGIILLLLVVIS